MDEARAPRVATVIVDATELDVAQSFWTALLDVEVAWASDHYVFLEAQPDTGVNVAFQRVDEAKVGKNRVHLDLHVADLPAAVERAVSLGAVADQEHVVGPYRWQVLRDPLGNEFCLVASAPA